MHRSSTRATAVALCLLAAVLCVAALLIYLLFKHYLPGLWQAFSAGDEDAIAAFLDSKSFAKGILILWFLNFVQVLSIVIPAMPVQLAAGIGCGTWIGFLVSFTAAVSANLAVYCVARRITKVLAALSEDHPKLGKFLSTLQSSENAAYYTFLAFLTPGLPNGLVPYAAASAGISAKSFAVALITALPVPTLLTCYAGSLVVQGNVFFSALLIVGLYVLVAVLFSKRKKYAKKMI